MSVPGYLPYYIVLGNVGVIVVVLLGLRRALARAAWPAPQASRARGVAALALAGWFVATATLAWLGAYQGGAGRIPTIQFGVLVPVLVGALLIWGSPAVSRIIDAVPQQWLVGVQIYRVIGLIFLVLWAGGSLPGFFAVPAGLGDIAVGVLAPFVAWAYSHNPSGQAGSVRAWNIAGIADFVVALVTGFMTAPTLARLFGFDPPNVLIDSFPLVLIPVFLVPLSMMLHMASLTKLRRTAAHASPLHSDAAASA